MAWTRKRLLILDACQDNSLADRMVLSDGQTKAVGVGKGLIRAEPGDLAPTLQRGSKSRRSSVHVIPLRATGGGGGGFAGGGNATGRLSGRTGTH